MFELAASEFHRGTLHIEAEKVVSSFRKWANSIGPIKSRFISMGILVFAFLLNVNPNPARFFFESGHAPTLEAAWQLQLKLSYFLVAFGVLVHVLLGFWRREVMVLDFDKSKSQLRFYHQGSFHYSRPAEGVVPFSEIRGIEVVNKKTSKNSVGYVEIQLPTHLGKTYSSISIGLLSEDQMKFYPLNIYRITNIQPKGDWVDPDDEPVET